MTPFKYCPNCTSKNNEFIDNHRFECFDCGMVFFQNIAAAVAVIIEKDNKILFTVRNAEPKKDMMDLPGGFIDPKETAEGACSRELNEELNLEIEDNTFAYFRSEPNLYEYKGVVYRTSDMIFTTQFPKKADFRLEEAEIQDIKWVEKTDIDISEIAFPSLQNAVKAYLES